MTQTALGGLLPVIHLRLAALGDQGMRKLLRLGLISYAAVLMSVGFGATRAQTLPGQPANSYVYGSSWGCNKGYVKKGNRCAGIFENMAGGQPTSAGRKSSETSKETVRPIIPALKKQDTSSPTISIASSIEVNSDKPIISGRVSDASIISQVSVGGRAVIVEPDGNFSFSRYVPISGGSVSIVAIDEWGNKSQKSVNLVRISPKLVSAPSFSPLDPTSFSGRRNQNAVALIIGVAKYKRTATARFADKDASGVRTDGPVGEVDYFCGHKKPSNG